MSIYYRKILIFFFKFIKDNFINDDQTHTSDLKIIEKNKNILKQKLHISEAILTGNKIINNLSFNLAEYSPLGSSIEVSTTSIQMSVKRVRASDLDTLIFEGLGKIKLPSFCDLLGKNQINISKIKDFFDWNDLNNCTNELITIQVDLKIKLSLL